MFSYLFTYVRNRELIIKKNLKGKENRGEYLMWSSYHK